MSIEAITNYMEISARVSSSGQPEEYQFKHIAEAGYQVVINIAMPNSENAIPEEGNIVTAHKMSYVNIPVPFDTPNAQHLRQFINVMTALADERIWVHCVLNYRVSAFLFHYQQIVLGESQEEAKKVILPSWEPNETWKKFMMLSREKVLDVNVKN